MVIATSSAATSNGTAVGYPLVGFWGILLFCCVAVRAAKSGCEVLAELGPGLVVAADCGGGCLAEATSRAQVLNLMHSVLRPA